MGLGRRRRTSPTSREQPRARVELPALMTERLRLRPFTAADAAAFRRLAGEFAVADTTLTIPHPYGDGVAETWLVSLEDAFAEERQAVFAITDRRSGALVGAVRPDLAPGT